DGDFPYVFEHTVGAAHLVAPAVAVESVAAGGGSVCWLDHGLLRVGPQSAGASPGPACYGGGGPLTLTDVNLLLGRLNPRAFEIPINPEHARARAVEIVRALECEHGQSARMEDVLEGFLQIANERMADAIRSVSVREGYDPSDYALVAFGGAGGQHACAIAGLLDIRKVLIPEDAGLLSAVGLGHGAIERFAERHVLEPLENMGGSFGELLAALESEARRAVEGEGIVPKDVEVRRRIASLRFEGQDASLQIEFTAVSSLPSEFSIRYREVYGHMPGNRAVELESLRVVASSPRIMAESPTAFQPLESEVTAGPALLFDPYCSIVVDEGWCARRLSNGGVLLQKVAG
ncbi:5-oxoprolinase, partial [Candidatus Poribacteria bacterium]|nr:5-oxoprolinase [Candidatus Poribacteria bacterium]